MEFCGIHLEKILQEGLDKSIKKMRLKITHLKLQLLSTYPSKQWINLIK